MLAGDDAALPAIETILDALPAEAQVRVVLEAADAQEERPLSASAQLDITWLHRSERPADAALEEAVRTMQLPAGNGRIYVGC